MSATKVPSNGSIAAPYSPVNPPLRVRVHFSTMMPLKAAKTSCTQCRGLHTRRLPTSTTELYNQRSSSENDNLQLNRLGFKEPKSKKLFTFHSIESSKRTQTDAPNAMARAHKVLKSFTHKSQQSYKSLWGNKRGRTKRKTPNESSRSRSNMFLSHREGFDW